VQPPPVNPCSSIYSYLLHNEIRRPFPFVVEWLAGGLAPAPARRKPLVRERLWALLVKADKYSYLVTAIC
jgi:hypothetical protein